MPEIPTSNDRRPFQLRVVDWMMETFSMEVCRNTTERNHRFLEEALELVQAMGCTAAEAHMLVDYTFGRPVGDPEQEVGGALVTLAALCAAADVSMAELGDRELARCWQNIEKIRAKQAGKPKHSPLPGASAHETKLPQGGIEWSETRNPDGTCGYHHIIGQTVFGRILITWKGWKQYSTPTVDESPWGFMNGAGDPESTKQLVQEKYDECLRSALGITVKAEPNAELAALKEVLMEAGAIGDSIRKRARERIAQNGSLPQEGK